MVALLEMSASQNSSATDHLVPKKESKTLTDLDSATAPKKRRVNFNLTIDIKQEDACVPQGPNSLSDFSDGESLSDQPIPTTPGGKPQVLYKAPFIFRKFSDFFVPKNIQCLLISAPSFDTWNQ